MWLVGRIALLVVLGAVSVSGAKAADLVTYPTSTGQQLPVTNAAPAYDWSGFYSGIYGVYQHSPDGGVKSTSIASLRSDTRRVSDAPFDSSGDATQRS